MKGNLQKMKIIIIWVIENSEIYFIQAKAGKKLPTKGITWENM
jgi:hypothetical protein